MVETSSEDSLRSLLERQPERGVDTRRRCPACLGESSRLLADVAYDSPEMGGFRGHPSTADYEFLEPLMKRFSYRVVECRGCGLAWQPHVLSREAERRYYGRPKKPPERGKRTRKWGASWLKFNYYAGLVERASSIFHLLAPRPPEEIEVLDFGAGWGEFCAAARALGYGVTAAELNPRKTAWLESQGVACLELPAERSFDFIHADQVFEHLADPAAMLSMLREHLREGGFVMLGVPTVRRRGLARALGRGELKTVLKLYPFVHVNMFSGRSLRALGERVGLEPVEARAPLARRLGLLGPGGLAGLRLRVGSGARHVARRVLPRWERLFGGVQVFRRAG